MTEDERRNKLHAENRFYLELHHQYGGNFEAMLTTDELTIWNTFPNLHKHLFTYWDGWEWLVKSSLQAFEDSSLIARGVSKRELAWSRFNHYRRQVKARNKFMSLDELAAFLFPLIEVKADYLRQEIIKAIYEGTLNPEELRIIDSGDWEQYESGNYGINIQWLEIQDSDYLTQCADVWHSYLFHEKENNQSMSENAEYKEVNGSRQDQIDDAVKAFCKKYPKRKVTPQSVWWSLPTICHDWVERIETIGEGQLTGSKAIMKFGLSWEWRAFKTAFNRYKKAHPDI